MVGGVYIKNQSDMRVLTDFLLLAVGYGIGVANARPSRLLTAGVLPKFERVFDSDFVVYAFFVNMFP